jgi:hypothetical protein
MAGTLCRGEYLEFMLRITWQRYKEPKLLGPHLDEFLETYI